MNNLVGEILIKNGDIISSPLLNINKDKVRKHENTLEFEKMIINVLYTSAFSSKMIGRDNFTYEIYNSSDFNIEKDLNYEYIKGITNKYIIPRGLVIYHNKNKFMMDCLNLEYMIYYNCIPFSITNIPKNLIFKRTSGFIQHGKIEDNASLYINYNKNFKIEELALRVLFSQQETKDTTIPFDCCKRIYLSEYLDLNKEVSEIKINFEYINKDQDLEDEIYKEFIDFYNNKLDKFITYIKKIILLNKYPLVIEVS